MNKRIINMLFLMAIFLYVFVSFCRPIFKPKNIIDQENRYANKFENISMNSFFNGTLQKNFEDTFSDQIILSGRLKTANNLFKGIIVDEMVKSYYKNHDLSYLKIDNVNFYGPNNLVYSTRDLNDLKQYYVEYKSGKSTKMMWIEDGTSIAAKVSLVTKYNLGGTSCWEKDRETSNIWTIIREELEKTNNE